MKLAIIGKSVDYSFSANFCGFLLDTVCYKYSDLKGKTIEKKYKVPHKRRILFRSVKKFCFVKMSNEVPLSKIVSFKGAEGKKSRR